MCIYIYINSKWIAIYICAPNYEISTYHCLIYTCVVLKGKSQ